jgi:hypothetical protein
MSESNLDIIKQKLESSSSTMNLYSTGFNQSDRIVLNSSPCSNNASGSCRGYLDSMTPVQFQAFDVGRDTPQTLAQLDDCLMNCQEKCSQENYFDYNCIKNCNIECDNTRKDFI